MEQIIKNIFRDQELASHALKTAKELLKYHLTLKGGTSCWVGNKQLYTFIFEDTSDIASMEAPFNQMTWEEQRSFRTRQNRRANLLYQFTYNIMGKIIPQNINLADITNRTITITFTIL